MKRIIALLMVLLLICSAFTACAPKDPEENTTIDPMENTTAAEQTAPPSTDVKPKLPEYVPGSIKLEPQDEDDYQFERKYRLTYYRIWGAFSHDLLDKGQMEDYLKWFDNLNKENNFGELQNEMFLVALVKRYNIPREKFDEAVKAFVTTCEEENWDMTQEEYEVPNADIIYTFDNEIINRYYRYE